MINEEYLIKVIFKKIYSRNLWSLSFASKGHHCIAAKDTFHSDINDTDFLIGWEQGSEF